MSATIATCTPPAAAVSIQPVQTVDNKPVAHDDAAHPLNDLNPDRHLSNPSPSPSDHSPTSRDLTAPLDNNNASSIEEAFSHLATEGAPPHSSLDAAIETLPAHDLAAPPSLLRAIDRLRSIGFPIPPKIEVMLRVAQAFDRNGSSVAPRHVIDPAKVQSILERGELLFGFMDVIAEFRKSPSFAALASASEADAGPVLTQAEVSGRDKSWILAELARTGDVRTTAAVAEVMVMLALLETVYDLWRERWGFEEAK